MASHAGERRGAGQAHDRLDELVQRRTADLGELVTGRKPGRQSPGERTMAMNLGLALDDMAVAPEVLKRATQAGLGTWLPL